MIIFNNTHSTAGQQDMSKIKLHKFRQGEWVEVLIGELAICPTQNQLEISYSERKETLPAEFPEPLLAEQHLLKLPLRKVREVERDQSDKTILYFWVGLDPIALSFLSPQACDQALRSLANNSDNEIDELDNDDEISMEYIKHCLEGNPAMLTILFSNNKAETLDYIFKGLEEELQKGEPDPKEKDIYFTLMKNAIKLGDRPMIEKMCSNRYFSLLLRALRFNPFNDKDFDYQQIFAAISPYDNILELADRQILEAYQENSRIKFLKDCVTCMFIEIDTERIFNSIINSNNLTIFKKIILFPEFMNSLAKLAHRSPQKYLNVVVELWEIYKYLNIDFDTKWVKEDFSKMFVQNNLHNLVLLSAQAIVSGEVNFEKSNISQARFHQRWIEALNPFISSQWEFAQQWLAGESSASIFSILLRILNKNRNKDEEGILQCILTFIRQLVEPSQNRIQSQSLFISVAFRDFVGKLWEQMREGFWLIEQYLDFIMKLYRVETLRTRRIIIQTGVLVEVNQHLTRKPILIQVIKCVQGFLEVDNFDIFRYLRNNNLFIGLREEYLRNMASSNMINCCFRALMKSYRQIDDLETQEYFGEVFLAQENKQLPSLPSPPPEVSQAKQGERIIV